MKLYDIVLLQGAQSDLLNLYMRRGEKVYRQVDKALGVLRWFPEVAPIHAGEFIRRLVVSKTHLGIFYSVTGDRILVGAVLDLRQSPETISGRLDQL